MNADKTKTRILIGVHRRSSAFIGGSNVFLEFFSSVLA